VDLDEHGLLQDVIHQCHPERIGIAPMSEDGVTRIAVNKLFHEDQERQIVEEANKRLSDSGNPEVPGIPNLDAIDHILAGDLCRHWRRPSDRRDDADVEMSA
jgi:hypothetical protein